MENLPVRREAKLVVSPLPAQVPVPRAGHDELEVLIRARYPVIYVVSWEEERVERHLNEIAMRRNKKFYTWTCTQGLVKYGAEAPKGKSGSNTADAISGMDAVLAHVEPGIFLMKDLHMWIKEVR